MFALGNEFNNKNKRQKASCFIQNVGIFLYKNMLKQEVSITVR